MVKNVIEYDISDYQHTALLEGIGNINRNRGRRVAGQESAMVGKKVLCTGWNEQVYLQLNYEPDYNLIVQKGRVCWNAVICGRYCSEECVRIDIDGEERSLIRHAGDYHMHHSSEIPEVEIGL